MFKYIKGLFAPEPEAAAPSNLILFTPTKTEWDAKTVIKLFDAGLGKLHIQPNREWRVGDYEKFLKKVPKIYWPRIVLEEHHQLVLNHQLGGFQMYHGDRIPARWPKSVSLSCKCHSYDEMRSLPKALNYVFLSPIFPSISKRDYVPQRTTREFQVIAERWRSEGGCPVYGLGGVTPQNATRVREMGLDGVAFIGSVWETANPVKSFIEIENAWYGKSARKLKRKY